MLSREEIQRLEGAAGSERDELIIRLLADTGMRVGKLRWLDTTGVRHALVRRCYDEVCRRCDGDAKRGC